MRYGGVEKLPEVSLMTSWAMRGIRDDSASIPGMRLALDAHIDLLDLFYLAPDDIPYYLRLIDHPISEDISTPSKFAAALVESDILLIANALNAELSRCSASHKMGRRPRFSAVATYFPEIGIYPHDEESEHRRVTAVAALRNTLYLAHMIGCRVVEVVGGQCIPASGQPVGDWNWEDYRKRGLKALSAALESVFSNDSGLIEGLGPNPLDKLDNPPCLALELEPGRPYLLNDHYAFIELRDHIQDHRVRQNIRLNADIAHMFILGYKRPQDLPQEVQECIVHMHISDHAGTSQWGGSHAADLPPGTFHFRDDYEPWLRFAIQQANAETTFSGAIAVEMEAVGDINEACAAVNIARAWLSQIEHPDYAERAHDPVFIPTFAGINNDTHEGAILVVDIGNSTEEILGRFDHDEGCWSLKQIIESLCNAVYEKYGSVMSFTGDGFIAFFDHHQLRELAAPKALNTAMVAAAVLEERLEYLIDVFHEVRKLERKSGLPRKPLLMPRLTIRSALHWGKAYFPTKGHLSQQILSRDVVRAARVCDFLGQKVEKHLLKNNATNEPTPLVTGITSHFLDCLPEEEKPHWPYLETISMKGIGRTRVHINDKVLTYLRSSSRTVE
jgi:class 3 adenylate cyclase